MNSDCDKCIQLTKKLNILQADYDFEIKKMSEDKSTEKALFEISMQKELRKMTEKYQKEKQLHDDDNKKWI